jgi:hypothetical protein
MELLEIDSLTRLESQILEQLFSVCDSLNLELTAEGRSALNNRSMKESSRGGHGQQI